MDRRRAIHALGLAAVLLIAAALRFTHLGAFGMAPDEDVTLQIAVDIRHAHWDLDAVTSDDLHDHFRDMPVSYYMTAALIDPDAPSLFAARLLFALTGIAAVLLLYGFAREAAGPDTALVAALFLALSPTAIQYAQTARYVGPSMATAIAIAWTATRAMARPNAVRLSVAAAVALLGVATNLLTLILFPLIALWVLIAWRRRTDSPLSRRLVWGTVIALAVAAAVIVVLVLPFARSWFVENLRFIHHPLATKLARTARFGASTIGRIGPLVFALGLFGAWRLIREKSVPGQIAALFAFGPLACLAALSLLVYTPYRYAILAFPFVYLAAAIFVVYLADARRVAAWGVGAAVCLSLAFATGQYLKDGDGRKRPCATPTASSPSATDPARSWPPRPTGRSTHRSTASRRRRTTRSFSTRNRARGWTSTRIARRGSFCTAASTRPTSGCRC